VSPKQELNAQCFPGEYWGELGFFRIELGKNILGIESKVAWATPGIFTTHNIPCSEDGSHCGYQFSTYTDPYYLHSQMHQEDLGVLALGSSRD